MPKSKLAFGLRIFTALLGGAFLVAAMQSPAGAQQRKSLRWMTSAVGSYGYAAATSITKIVENALGGEYAVTIEPYPSTTLSMRTVMDGYGEIAYTADLGMTEFDRRVGGFKNYQPRKAEIAHTWYAYPMESMMATLASHAKFKCWRDFSGEPVFYTNGGFVHWLNWQRIFDTLGYKLKHVQIDLGANTRALQQGTIVGSAIYTIAGVSLPAYWKETESRLAIRIVNPCPDEIAAIKAKGLAVVDVDPKAAFAKDVGPSTLQGVPILFGYNARRDVPEETIYRLLSALYNERDNLVKLNAGFAPMAKDFVGMQVNGISANPQMAVHPGLARFLIEHKAWNEKWKIAASNI